MRNAHWKRVPIETVYHGLYDGPHATPKPSDEGPIFLGIKNITEDGHLDLTTIRHIAESEFPRWTRRIEPQPDDIVFTYEATLNRYALIPTGFRGCLGRRLALIRPDKTKVDPKFLLLYFFGNDWRDTIATNITSGSTVDRIPLLEFPGFKISLPPLPTQRKIASILSAYDDLIENIGRRIAIMEEMATMIFRQYMTVEHPLVAFSSLFSERLRNGVYKKKEFHGSGIKVVNMGELFAYDMICDQSMKLVELNAKEMKAATLSHGDLLFARRSLVLEGAGKCSIVLTPNSDMTFESSIIRARLDKEIADPLFYYHLFRSYEGRGLMASIATRTAVSGIRGSDLSELLVPCPPTSVQRAFVNDVSNLADFALNSAKRLRALRATRDLLLPRLISGKLDVEDLDIDVGMTAEALEEATA